MRDTYAHPAPLTLCCCTPCVPLVWVVGVYPHVQYNFLDHFTQPLHRHGAEVDIGELAADADRQLNAMKIDSDLPLDAHQQQQV